MTRNRNEQLAYVQRVMTEQGLTMNALAEKSGLKASTLSKFMSGATKTLYARTIQRIAHASGIPPDQVLLGSQEGDAMPMKDRQSRTGEGVETFSMRMASRALDLEHIVPGDVLVFSRTAVPQTGDVVCVHKHDSRFGTTETLVRQFDTPFLLSRSTDGTLAKPILIDDTVNIVGVLVELVRKRLPKIETAVKVE